MTFPYELIIKEIDEKFKYEDVVSASLLLTEICNNPAYESIYHACSEDKDIFEKFVYLIMLNYLMIEPIQIWKIKNITLKGTNKKGVFFIRHDDLPNE